MNGSKELNAEEMLRRMEQMAEEMDRNERTICSLEADKEELLAEVGQQKRQISQLIDYAEALNRENSEEGVKKLEDQVGGYHWNALLEEMEKCGIEVHLETRCKSIDENGVTCLNNFNEEIYFPADTVLNAVGYTSKNSGFEALCGTAPVVQVIGDAHHPAKIQQAMWNSYFMALDV